MGTQFSLLEKIERSLPAAGTEILTIRTSSVQRDQNFLLACTA